MIIVKICIGLLKINGVVKSCLCSGTKVFFGLVYDCCKKKHSCYCLIFVKKNCNLRNYGWFLKNWSDDKIAKFARCMSHDHIGWQPLFKTPKNSHACLLRTLTMPKLYWFILFFCNSSIVYISNYNFLLFLLFQCSNKGACQWIINN